MAVVSFAQVPAWAEAGAKVFAQCSACHAGAPARVVRQLSDEDVANLLKSADSYVERRAQFLTKLRQL